MLTRFLSTMRSPVGKLRLLAAVALLGFALLTGEAVSRMFGGTQITGLTSTSSAGCNCHATGNNTATSLSVTSGSGSFTVDQNSTTSFTVAVAHSTQAAAGVGIAVKTSSTGTTNAGTLAVATGSGLQTVNSEITHDGPKTMNSGSASFTFSWTAPNAHGTYYIQAIGNAVDNSGTNAGDAWNWMSAQAVTVAGVTLTAPNASATYCTGSSVNVTWTSTGVTNVKIELSSDGGSTYPTVLNSSVSAALGSWSWTIPTNQTAGTNYRIRVSDAANSARVDGSDASFAIASAPSITAQPASQTICTGQPVTFSVTATGSNLAYQWRKGGTAITNATSSSYTINSVATGDAGSYDVQVGNACTTLTTTAATLTVNQTPAIGTQPAPQTVCVGEPASFSVVATGTNLTYQWRKGGVAINGATSSTYNIPSATTGDAANYDVVVSGTCTPSRTSNAVALTVRELPAITSQPTAQTVCSGQPASFTVGATGTNLTYQWRRNGVIINGATGATYSIGSATISNAGNYDVVVSGACTPSVTSAQARLTINPTPVFTSDPLSQTACEGRPVTFTASATGTGVTYQWRKNGLEITGATGASYTIDSVTSNDLGSYEVVATIGDCFTTSASAILAMMRPAAITGQPTDQSGVVGSTILLTATATGDDLVFTWKKNGAAVPGGTSATLTLANVQTTDAGSYSVEVKNACTTIVSSTATVTVLAPGAGAVLSLSPSTVDFGSTRVGVQKEQVLTGILRNAGDSVLTITNIAITGAHASDFSFAPVTLPLLIPPGESRSMTIRFTPGAIGARTSSMAFTSNAKENVSLALRGQGAIGALTPRAPALSAGIVAVGGTADSTIQVCNNSAVDVNVQSLSLASGAPFSIVSPTAPVTVAAGECIDVVVRFAPTAEGDFVDVLTIRTDGEPANVTIGISGRGGLNTAAPLEVQSITSLAIHPNPATDGVSIAMTLARALPIDVVVVDSRGNVVRRFAVREASTDHRLTWDARGEGGTSLPSGTYRVVARAGGHVSSTAVVIVR